MPPPPHHPPAIKVCLAAGEPAATYARVTTIKLRAAPSASKPGRCSGLAGRGDMGYNRSKITFLVAHFSRLILSRAGVRPARDNIILEKCLSKNIRFTIRCKQCRYSQRTRRIAPACLPIQPPVALSLEPQTYGGRLVGCCIKPFAASGWCLHA